MKDARTESHERLIHIQEAIIQIESFVVDKEKEDFLSDELLSSAVLFQFSVIGEAVVHVDSFYLEKFEYPWYKVRSFRNLISHEYFNIKLEAIWKIIENDLEELKKAVNNILKNEF